MNNAFTHNGKLLGVTTGPIVQGITMITSTRHLGAGDEDRPEKVAEFARVLGVAPKTFIFSRQIHSDNIQVFTSTHNLENVVPLDGVDAMIATVPGIMMTVFTADCVPIFFADASRGIIGIAHCGWKGTFLRLTEKVIGHFCRLGSVVNDITVRVGPSICQECYEVSHDLVTRFIDEFEDTLFRVGIIQGRYLDLGKLNTLQAEQTGVPEKNIFISGYCTRCRTDLFFSYRGEQKKTGRILSSILLHKDTVDNHEEKTRR